MGTNATRIMRRHKDNEVVGSHLHYRVGGVALCQTAPHEHHCCAGCRAQQYRTGEIFRGEVGRDKRFEHREEEQAGDAVHGKRLHDPCDEQSLGVSAHIFNAAEIHLHHHGIDHHPDEDCHGNGHSCVLKPIQECRDLRQKFTDADTNHHAENHPHGQILLECADSALFFAHKSPPKIYKFKCIDM